MGLQNVFANSRKGVLESPTAGSWKQLLLQRLQTLSKKSNIF
jgi:hypothetical protein